MEAPGRTSGSPPSARGRRRASRGAREEARGPQPTHVIDRISPCREIYRPVAAVGALSSVGEFRARAPCAEGSRIELPLRPKDTGTPRSGQCKRLGASMKIQPRELSLAHANSDTDRCGA